VCTYAFVQVTSRVIAESGSRPGVGLVPHTGMQPAVLEGVRLQKLAQAAAAADGQPVGCAAAGSSSMGRGNPTGPLAAAAATGHCRCAGGLSSGDGEVQLLAQHGYLPAAEGVYCRLWTWLQQQAPHTAGQPAQQQQEQEQHQRQHGVGASEGEARLQSAAAAAAAALAPQLLAGVLQQQGHLPATKLVSAAPWHDQSGPLSSFLSMESAFQCSSKQIARVHAEPQHKCT
jgi:hypothetical protein